MSEEIESASGIIENCADAVETIADLTSGIPTPIKKNAFKAFGQLCTAAVDIPVAYLEGAAAERRAETQARIKLIDTGADQIAKQMEVHPEYAHIAVKKFGQKILREQINLDIITKNAMDEITQESYNEQDDSVENISSDWLNAFEKEAVNMSSDEMQLLFGKILAGEIKKPSSFSIRVVNLVSQLDKRTAASFQLLCSLSTAISLDTHVLDARVISLGGNASQNCLQKFGVTFSVLNALVEYGLVIPEFNSYMDYGLSVVRAGAASAPFKYQGKFYFLIPTGEGSPAAEFKFAGIALSLAGVELSKVVEMLPAEGYTAELQQFFLKNNLQMVEDRTPRT
ncbi:MAG: DUF2806 domain-containing protein [Mariprofundus sp.]|nr:DUF2806 domain-containing protein [Mariprofundus sp.]